jgi:fumarate reductase subunit D
MPSLTAGARLAGSALSIQGIIVPSRRALGVFALGAVVLAAISFAAVDVTIANASGCAGASTACTDSSLPVIAIVCAAIGTVALLASVVPAVAWLAHTIHHPRHDAEVDSTRFAVLRPAFDEDDL